jgi:DnaJ-domain-containing protein 1
MPDYFALLDEPRRPWLEPEALKQKFLARSTVAHPDKFHSAGESERAAAAQAFAELNAAYNCLVEPKTRLLHLLELERGAKPKDIQQIPGSLADLFAEVAVTCRQADLFLAEKAKVVSPLLQVKLFERGQEWVEKLNELQRRLSHWHGQLLDQLKSLDEQWATPAMRPQVLPGLEDLYRFFGYFNRWHNQIQERVVQLSL